MKKTGYLYDKSFLLHETSISHPERPERLKVIHENIKKIGLLKKLILFKAVYPDSYWIERVHTSEYVKKFRKASLSGKHFFLYPDNIMSKNTFQVANLAVGGIINIAKKMMEGSIDNAFCAIRPPGHHAEIDQAIGFCYFNNIAILAKYLKKEWNIKKIAIIDFDVHHGNGTQNIFERDSEVFYYSIHQDPLSSFPGTGKKSEIGIGKGYGYNKNLTVQPKQGDKIYREIILNDMMPVLSTFKPEIILLSSGFDAHRHDSMSDIKLSTNFYSWLMIKIGQLAEKYSKGRIISLLEGGYNLEKLPKLVSNHIKILLN